LKACAIAVCMPTPWHSDDDVEQAYGLLDVLLDECALNSVLALLGGDWNARLGACKNGDDSAVLGIWGSEGTMFVDRLRIFSGLETNMPVEDSWTCTRVNDNAFTQWDFSIGGLQFEHDKFWHDNCLGTGLNHRCVHSLLKIRVAKRTFGLKNWQPFIDNDGRPSNFQSRVRKLLRTSRMAHFAFRPSRRLGASKRC